MPLENIWLWKNANRKIHLYSKWNREILSFQILKQHTPRDKKWVTILFSFSGISIIAGKFSLNKLPWYLQASWECICCMLCKTQKILPSFFYQFCSINFLLNHPSYLYGANSKVALEFHIRNNYSDVKFVC